MREILFRGKQVDNGEWVYGSYYHCCETAYGATFIVVNDFGFIEVIPHTVGQYTGLTDKNGVKIFEGDIIKEDCGYEYQIGVVTFGDGYYDGGVCPFRGWFIDKFTLVREDEENDEDNFVFACDDHNSLLLIADEFEVIGNIYDNKDLLKEEV